MNTVRYGGDLINKVVTSKEEILKACREIVSEEGISAISMRAVAQRCHIALGSLYYYFSGKDELILKTIESVWQDIFHMDAQGREVQDEPDLQSREVQDEPDLQSRGAQDEPDLKGRPCRQTMSFPETVKWIFESVRRGAEEYPNFFTTHSLSFADSGKSQAKNTMDAYLGHMKSGMAEALKSDKAVRKDVFSEAFPENEFLDFVLASIIVLLLQRKEDCRVLLQMVRKTIY